MVEEDVDVRPVHRLVALNLIRTQALLLLLTRYATCEIMDDVALQRHERSAEVQFRLLGVLLVEQRVHKAMAFAGHAYVMQRAGFSWVEPLRNCVHASTKSKRAICEDLWIVSTFATPSLVYLHRTM